MLESVRDCSKRVVKMVGADDGSDRATPSGELAGRDGVTSVVGGVVAFFSLAALVHHPLSLFVFLRLTLSAFLSSTQVLAAPLSLSVSLPVVPRQRGRLRKPQRWAWL